MESPSSTAASLGASATTPQAPCGDRHRSSGAKRPSDFSIEHILRAAGQEGGKEGAGGEGNPAHGAPRRGEQQDHSTTRFEWLQCTRYHPPKLPRSRRKEASCPRDKGRGGPLQQREGGGGRRKLGRNPRIPFSSGQVSALESRFRRGHYLSSADVASLARALDLSEARVKIWFQNRRARERRDRETARAGAEGPAVTRREAAVGGDHPVGHAAAEGRVVAALPADDVFPPRPAEGGRLDLPLALNGSPVLPCARRPAALSPFPRTLQGLNSAFVPFPRSRVASQQPPPSVGGPPASAPLVLMAYLGSKAAAPATV